MHEKLSRCSLSTKNLPGGGGIRALPRRCTSEVSSSFSVQSGPSQRVNSRRLKYTQRPGRREAVTDPAVYCAVMRRAGGLETSAWPARTRPRAETEYGLCRSCWSAVTCALAGRNRAIQWRHDGKCVMSFRSAAKSLELNRKWAVLSTLSPLKVFRRHPSSI